MAVAVAAAVVCLLLVAPAAQGSGLTVGHSGWFWGEALPQGNDLSEVEVAGSRAYAVGAFGTALRSDDGGRRWEALRSGTTTDLHVVEAIGPESLVVSGGCEARRSDDGGRTFRWLALAAGEACGDGIGAVAFPTPSAGYVLSFDGTIRTTTDGGRSFERRTAVPTGGARMHFGDLQSGATDLVFTDLDTGIATTADGRVLRTVDGARTWTEVASAGSALNGLDFVDATTGFAVGRDRRAIKTADGGRTWSSVPLAGSPMVDLKSISCADASNCLIVLDDDFGDAPDYVLRTTDGGETAGSVSPSRYAVFAAGLGSSGQAVAVGRFGSIAASQDAGERFTLVSRTGGLLGHPRVRAASPTRVYAFGEDGTVTATTDGGTNFTDLVVPTEHLVDGAFPTARKGFVLSYGGKVLTTDDGGERWQVLKGRGPRESHALVAFGERDLLVVGTDVRRSTDGGRSFRSVRALPIAYSSISRADRAGRGTAVIWNEDGRTQPAISHDRGRTWRRLNRPRGVDDVFEIDFVSRRTGFLVDTTLADYRRVFVTRNGGRSWRALPAIGANDPSNIAFSDRLHGYVEVDESRPTVLRTSNGGRSWRPQPIAPGGGSDLVAPSARRAYAYYDLAGSFMATATGGDAGAPSRIALEAARRRLHRPGVVTIRGMLRPPVAGARVTVARRSRGGWKRRHVRTDARGRFTSRWRVGRTSAFAAQWTGDGLYRAAGTGELRIPVVGLDRKPRRRR